MSLFSASSHEGQPPQRRVHPSPGFTTRISLCCGCFQPLPWISASLPCQLGLLLPLPQHQLVPSALPSCARLLSPSYTAGLCSFYCRAPSAAPGNQASSVDPRGACPLCASSEWALVSTVGCRTMLCTRGWGVLVFQRWFFRVGWL